MLMVNANYTPADAIDSPCSTHLIDGDGNFNSDGIDNFIKKVKLAECGLSYAVVAIMGTQSSGKSTLLNNLFGTNFRAMNAMEGSSQTTKGIWMAWGVGIEPGTIVMDLEGTDGSDSGEDDTAFEKQRALFALAVSDIVLINMCCHDIGREQGPNKPLLKTIFQVMMRLWCHDIGREQGPNKPLLKTVFQVMMRLFSPRKTTLMFVIRDKTRTPLENLELQLWKHIQKIWDSVPKPEAHKATPLSDFFYVEVVALTSYEWMEEQFKEEVANLRQRFFHSTAPGGLAEDRRGVVPASGFSFGAQEIWKLIKENKDLDLPAHKVMVATMRCEEIADEKFSSFMTNEEWRQLEETAQSGQVPGFGKKLTSLLGIRLSEYDTEARHFEECVRTSKRKHLEDKLLQLVRPTYQIMLGHIQTHTLEKFKEAFALVARDCSAYYMSQFDELSADAQIDQANWDSSKVREELRRDIDAHILIHKLSELTIKFETNLNEALFEPVEDLLEGASDDIWLKMRKLLKRKTRKAVTRFSDALSVFEMDEVTKKKMLSRLEDHSRGIVEAKAKEEAGRVLIRMKDRFSTLFCFDCDSMPRKWTQLNSITAFTRKARSASLKLLSVMAAVRLNDDTDNIEETLSLALLDTSKGISVDALAASSWDGVPSLKTLLTPVQCKNLWEQFIADTEHIVSQARKEKYLGMAAEAAAHVARKVVTLGML